MTTPHIVCETCHQWIVFGSHLLTGASIQTCKCGSGPVTITRPPKVKESRNPAYRRAYRAGTLDEYLNEA